jgi:SGNH hydrolase-like domain, acetyltransferase AlgX
MDNLLIRVKAPSAKLLMRFQKDVNQHKIKDCYAKVVVGKDNWLFFEPELDMVSLPPELVLPISKQIEQFHQELAQIGIELIYAPIPTKWAVYPEKISDAVTDKSSEVTRLDVNRQKLFQKLRTKGVTVVDLMPVFLEHKAPTPVFFKNDTHWSPVGAMIAAQEIARRIKSLPWYRNLPTLGQGTLVYTSNGTSWNTLRRSGDLYGFLIKGGGKAIGGKIPVEEEVKGRYIEGPNSMSTASPILILGDSNMLAFPDDLSFRQQLAYELGIKIDQIASAAGANAPREELARLANIDPDYVLNKKIIIWTHSGRYLRKEHFKNIKMLNEKLKAQAVSKTSMPDVGQAQSLDYADKVIRTGNKITLLGRISTASNPPIPRREPYEDAITFTLYEVLKVESGAYPEKQIIAVEWVMKKYDLLASAGYKSGDVHRITLIPFTEVENSSKIEAAMQRNDIDNYVLDWYWVTALENLKAQ